MSYLCLECGCDERNHAWLAAETERLRVIEAAAKALSDECAEKWPGPPSLETVQECNSALGVK